MNIVDIKDLLIIITQVIIIYNIGAWYREYRSKRNIDLAEETLALFYEAKDIIAWIRSPYGFTNETDLLKQGVGESEGQFEARKRANFIFSRYEQHKELFNKIQSIRYRFIAQLGKTKAKPFDALNQIVSEIIMAARRLIRLWPERYFANEQQKASHCEKIKKNEDIIWDTHSDDDPINPQVAKVISDMESICRDIIMCKGALEGLLNRNINKE